MSQALSNLIHDAQKDRDLFMDLMVDLDAAIQKRKLTLATDEVEALRKCLENIREEVRGEFAVLESAAIGGRGLGVIGW